MYFTPLQKQSTAWKFTLNYFFVYTLRNLDEVSVS